MVLDERPKEMDTRLLQEEEAEDTKADVKETPREEGTDGKEESLASKSKKNKRSFFGRKIQAIDRAVRRKIGSMRKRILRVRKSFSKLRKRKDELSFGACRSMCGRGDLCLRRSGICGKS